jgi:MFS family permease
VWPLKTAQRVIIVAGCCGMAYTQLTLSAASIDFVRTLGGTGLHVGILNALPVGMLFLQFLAAIVANHLAYRRRLWMGLSLLQRTIVVPVAFGPVLWPEISDAAWTWTFLAAIAVNQGLLHFCTPLWLSWMGDYLPHAGLNAFWGLRQRWMQWTAAASLLSGALLLYQTGLGVRIGYPVLAIIAASFGVLDILLFVKVEEPPVTPLPDPNLKRVLTGPFLHRGFRSFIGFMCFWHFTAMIGAAFISLYLLQYVGMTLFAVLLLWTCSWTGGAVMSRRMGRLADRFGNKPVLVLCVTFKSINMIALLAVPPDPGLAFQILAPVFMVDAVLNAGFAIATNGFLLKNSPAENRTMYIAAGTALAGLVGGVTAIVGGGILSALGDWSILLGGWNYTGFHLLFSISLVLRFAAAGIVSRIHEPESYDTVQVVTQLIGVTPLRVMRYPVGLYRSWSGRNGNRRGNGGKKEAGVK